MYIFCLKKYCLLLTVQFVIPFVMMGQVHQIKNYSHMDFVKLLEQPSKFNSTQRTEIYLNEILSYIVTNKDTLPALFIEMESFGRKINDNYVIAMALVSKCELPRMEGKYDGVIDLHKQALKLFDGYPKNIASSLTTIGDIYTATNQLDSAEFYIEMAMNKSLVTQDTHYFVDAYLVRGVLRSKQKKYYSAIDDYLKALSYGDKADLPLKKSNTYNRIAGLYSKVKDFQNAIKYNDLALQIAEDNGYRLMYAEMCLSRGEYLQEMDSLQEAKIYLDKALNYFIKTKNEKNLIATYSELALIDLLLHDINAAEKKINQASQYLNRDISSTHKFSFYYTSAYLLQKKGLIDESTKTFLKMLSFSSDNDDDLNKKSAFQGLKENAAMQGKWKEAYAYSDSITNLTNKLDLKNQQKLILDLESKYESELKESQINQLNSKGQIQNLLIEKKDRQLIYFGIGLTLAVLALYGFLIAYLTKNKSNQILNDKNNQLMEALENNKMLVKEIHHRVKNNLQVVSSLLNLQSRFEHDDTVLQAINTGKYRVLSMSLLHQSLYLNEDLNSIHIKKYFEDLAKSIFKGYPLFGKEVKLILEIEDIQLDVDTVVPLGLISNELITNSLKYAYNDVEDCMLTFSIKESEGMIRLIVKDNGYGIKFTTLPAKSTTMGMQLIKSFASKIKATVDIDNFKGTEFKLTFDRRIIKSTLKVVRNAAS